MIGPGGPTERRKQVLGRDFVGEARRIVMELVRCPEHGEGPGSSGPLLGVGPSVMA